MQPAFALTAANAPAVAEVCRRLDGIPLALELAAARVRVLTPEQLAARLGDRFRLLTGGGRTALRRQQTLQATVDWSHDLLAEPERALFRRLAVFPGGAAGGFPLEAAEAVGAGDGAGDPVAAADVLDLLTGLVDKSLVLAEARGAEERYRLLETLRQYAGERLLQAGEAAAVRDRHAAWCLALARAVAAAAAAGAAPPAARPAGGSWASGRACGPRWPGAPPAPRPPPPASSCWPTRAAAGRGGHGERAPPLAGDLPGAGARPHGDPRPVPARPGPLPALAPRVRPRRGAAREAREIFEALGDPAGAAEAAVHEGLVAANLGEYDRGVALIAPPWPAPARGATWCASRSSRATWGWSPSRGGTSPPPGPAWRRAAPWPSAWACPPAAVGRPAWPPSIASRGLPAARARLEATLARAAATPPSTRRAGRSSRCVARPGRPRPRRGAVRGGAHPPARPAPVPAPRGEVGLLAAVAGMAGMLEVARGAPARRVTLLAAPAPAARGPSAPSTSRRCASRPPGTSSGRAPRWARPPTPPPGPRARR